MKHTVKAALGGVGIAAAMAAGVGLASPAQADPGTSALVYLQTLNRNGIVVYDTSAALSTGLTICSKLNYQNGEDVAVDLYRTTTYSDVPTVSVAEIWVVSAVQGLCPGQYHGPGSSSSQLA